MYILIFMESIMEITKKSLVLKKHSAMIQTNAKRLTLMQRKMINFFLYKLQEQGIKDYYSTTISEVKDICGILETNNKKIKSQLNSLKNASIEYNYLNKDKNEVWGFLTLIPWLEVEFGTGEINYEIPIALKKRLIRPLIYTPLNLLLISKFRSKYSIVLYEFLRDYIGSPKIPLVSIDDIKILLGVEDNKYRFFKDLKNRVLDVAMEEINDITELNCDYDVVKGRRSKITHIQFIVEEKKNWNFDNLEDTINSNGKEKEKEKDVKELFSNRDDILKTLKEEHRISNIYKIIVPYLKEGDDYIISNIAYTYKQSDIKNFAAYLLKALKNDYGLEIREIESSKRKKEAEERQKDLKEKINLLNSISESIKNGEKREVFLLPGGSIFNYNKWHLWEKLDIRARKEKIEVVLLIEEELNSIELENKEDKN